MYTYIYIFFQATSTICNRLKAMLSGFYFAINAGWMVSYLSFGVWGLGSGVWGFVGPLTQFWGFRATRAPILGVSCDPGPRSARPKPPHEGRGGFERPGFRILSNSYDCLLKLITFSAREAWPILEEASDLRISSK